MKGDLTFKGKVISLLVAGVVMALGLVLFKLLPMRIFGREILFDASMHITVAIFLLYILWYFVDQNNSWRIPYFIFAAVVVIVVSLQRIVSNAHNDTGLLIGFAVSSIGIIISRWNYFRNKFSF